MADAIYGLLTYPALPKVVGKEGLEEVNQLKWEHAALKIKSIYETLS